MRCFVNSDKCLCWIPYRFFPIVLHRAIAVFSAVNIVDCVWNVMAHTQKPDFVFRRNGRVHLIGRGVSVQSTTGSRGVRISGSSAGYTMFRGSVKGTRYPLHSPVSPSLPHPCVTVCRHISTGLYQCAETSVLLLLSDSAFTVIKATCSPYMPWEHIGSGGMAPFILDLEFRWKRMVSSRPGPFTPTESIPFIH